MIEPNRQSIETHLDSRDQCERAVTKRGRIEERIER